MSIEVSGDSCFIEADGNRMNQVLTNLVSNAIKYTLDGGHIQMVVKEDAQCGTIQVKDNGIGIPGKDIPLIFERFYRTDTSRSRKTGGAGIGLTIAQSIVKAHGGTITVESQVNVGSCFTVTIPK
jgi:signal transduction histidine kinase